MIFTSLIQTRARIDAKKPNICIEVFQDGVEGSYKLLMMDYAKLTAPQKKIYDDFISAVMANSDEQVSDCAGNLLNAPTFNNNNITIAVSQNGAYTGFCPCDIDYNKMKVAEKNKVSAFVTLIQQLIK